MKVLSLIASMFLMATMAMACTEKDSTGILITEKRNVESFDRISVSAPVTVNIVCGQTPSVKVTSNEQSIKSIVTEVVDGELIIKVETGHKRINKKTIVDVCTESLIGLRASGACDVIMPQRIVSDDFELRVSGASDVLISNLEVKGLLNAEISGASDLDMVCKAGRTIVHASGASDVDIERIDSQEIEISASGASDVDVRGKVDNLIVSASGSSEVNLRHLIFNSRDVHASGASDVDF